MLSSNCLADGGINVIAMICTLAINGSVSILLYGLGSLIMA